jgi:hypothetical protein
MSVNYRIINAPPNRVEQVLRDGWNYADWVVGAVHIRAVDPGWPAPGSCVHHRVGAWPLTLNDNTEVMSYEPGKSLGLRARLRPFGEAMVRLDWEQLTAGSCRVRMEEQFVDGPALTLRNKVADVVLHARNAESLARLEHLTRKYADDRTA